MTFELDLKDLANGGSAFSGVAVYVWHCDRHGESRCTPKASMTRTIFAGPGRRQERSGAFTSIFPACYSGRWPHFHFEVYPDADSITDASKTIATSQVALPDETCGTVYAESGDEQAVANLAQITLASDNVFGDDSGGLLITTATGSVSNGYAVKPVAHRPATRVPHDERRRFLIPVPGAAIRELIPSSYHRKCSAWASSTRRTAIRARG